MGREGKNDLSVFGCRLSFIRSSLNVSFWEFSYRSTENKDRHLFCFISEQITLHKKYNGGSSDFVCPPARYINSVLDIQP
jgi:hypothetical protein